MQSERRGFSLVEVMVSLGILVILVGGLAAGFSRINEGLRNAARSTDLSNNSRGIFNIMQQDIYNAGLGFRDLNMLQVHVNNLVDTGESPFYSIANLQKDSGSPSEFTLQWFDYDLVFAQDFSNPTFVAFWEDGVDGSPWPVTAPDLVLMSMMDSGTAQDFIKPGDIFLVYCNDIVYDENLLATLTSKIDTDGKLSEDPTGASDQFGAMLLQANTVEVVPPPFSCTEGAFNSAVRISWGGPLFGNDFSADPVINPYTFNESFKCLEQWLAEDGKPSSTLRIKPPNGHWLARKLGDAECYHRVRYHVESGAGGEQALVRDDLQPDGSWNSMILTTGVVDFTVEVGTDVVGLNENLDGAVSTLDANYWFTDEDDSDLMGAGFHIIGRNTQAIKVQVTLHSLMDDLQVDQSLTDQRKTRTLTQLYRMRNAHLPLVNQ